LRETYREPVLLHAGDLNFNIEKIRELTSRSCSTKQIGPTSGELEPELRRKGTWKHTVIGARIHNGIAAEISATIDERDA